jgi:CRP-like cAMP-binding protein
VLRLARDVSYLPGEVIVREGDPGGELFVLLEGSARRGSITAAPARSALHDRARRLFRRDGDPRRRAAQRDRRGARAARLLALDGDSLKSLLRDMPEIALELLARDDRARAHVRAQAARPLALEPGA